MSYSNIEIVPWRKHLSFLAAAGLAACALLAAPRQALAAAANTPVQYSYKIPFTAGQNSTTVTVSPVTPTGKVFVIQTVSIYRYPASVSTLQTFLVLGTGYIALTDISETGVFYPTATTNLTGYVQPGTSASVNAYRTGTSLPAETDTITLSGYLTAY